VAGLKGLDEIWTPSCWATYRHSKLLYLCKTQMNHWIQFGCTRRLCKAERIVFSNSSTAKWSGKLFDLWSMFGTAV